MKEPKAFICDFPACPPSSLHEAHRWGKWTPDGKRIVFTDVMDLANLWAQSIDGGQIKPFTTFREAMGIMDFRWSPDGKRLAVARVGARSDVVLYKGLKRTPTKRPQS